MRPRKRTGEGHVRDAALRRLSRLNRWLVAASVTLTGALTAIAAHALPGKTVQSPVTKASHSRTGTTSKAAVRTSKAPSSPQSSGASSLHVPAQAPESAGEAETAPETEAKSEAAPEVQAEADPETQAETGIPSQGGGSESSTSQESRSAEGSPPVVSGGS
jgi:hypothetical protein